MNQKQQILKLKSGEELITTISKKENGYSKPKDYWLAEELLLFQIHIVGWKSK